ncbi:hypothetical protein EIN_260140 [Entamoeba invadens IP1]|uniref:Uncharacterized protein n=1 Tax=Entamoeba invadens IP1 TaxID=370355 RepID=A0A0A1UDE7_ENTIV|nr:hypothetical protein EIN_260140 [Entamoeba invadens IP1]ELP94366.1 hypothetical protein EIN_260140 [Entamoeba invadens IP1]|eukprot:XP_004261137.1 hypothetical protein EIN_260140 [Entamoeba invadens IP1]
MLRGDTAEGGGISKNHLLYQHVWNSVEFCHCGDFMLESAGTHVCDAHSKNSVIELSKMPHPEYELMSPEDKAEAMKENEAIDRNVSHAYAKLEKIAKVTIPELLKKLCLNVLQITNGKSTPDIEIFVLQVLKWLNRVVEINPVRSAIRASLKLEVDSRGYFLLTSCMKNSTTSKVTSDHHMKVTIHEVLLNLCILHKHTSSYVGRFLYEVMDEASWCVFENEYKLIFGSIPFYGTNLQRQLAPQTAKVAMSEFVPHFLETTIILLENNRLTDDVDAVQQCLSYLMMSQDSIDCVVGDEKNLTNFVKLCDIMTVFPTIHSKTTHTIAKQFNTFFVAVINKITVTLPHKSTDRATELVKLHTEVLNCVGQMLSTKIKATLPLLRKIVLGRDAGQTEADTQLFPSQFYLLSLFGFISDQLLVKNLVTALTPKSYFDLNPEVCKNIIEMVYLIYHFGHQKVTGSSLIELKKNKEPQNEVQDYFGELSCPLIYSSYIFAAQVAMLYIPDGEMVLVLCNRCKIRNDLNEYKDNEELYTSDSKLVELDFLNLLLSFNRFGYQDTSLQTFFEYYQTNISQASIVSAISSNTQEYIKKKMNTKIIPLDESENPLNVSPFSPLSFSVVVTSATKGSKTLKRAKSSEMKNKKGIGSRTSISISHSVISTTFSHQANRSDGMSKSQSDPEEENNEKRNYQIDPLDDALIMLYRKRRETQEVIVDEQKEFAEQTIRWRMEQLSIPAASLPSDFEMENFSDYFKKSLETFSSNFDFFFPFLNDSYSVAYKTQMIKRCIVDPIASGDFKSFFSFFGVSKSRTGEVKALKEKRTCLVTHEDLTRRFLKLKFITATNYFVYFRFLWIKLGLENDEGKQIVWKQKDVKMLATCLGYFFAEVLLFVPEDSVYPLLAIIFKALDMLPLLHSKRIKYDFKSSIYFARSVMNNIYATVYFIDEKASKALVDVPRFKSSTTALFGPMIKEAFDLKKFVVKK